MNMKLEFEFGNISHKIQFGNCNIMELGGGYEDILEFCSRLEQAKALEFSTKMKSKKLKKVCVATDFQTSDIYFKEYIYHAFRNKKFFKAYDLFVIENAEEFVNAEMAEIIAKHPKNYWILCSSNMPCIANDFDCVLITEGRKCWNEFIPETNSVEK